MKSSPGDNSPHYPTPVDFHVANIATLAAVITTTVIHPSTFSHTGFKPDPITSRLLVKSSTMTISGGAKRRLKLRTRTAWPRR